MTAQKRKTLTGATVLEAARRFADEHGTELCEEGLQEFIEDLGLDYTPGKKKWMMEVETLEVEAVGTREEVLNRVHQCVEKALFDEFGSGTYFSSLTFEEGRGFDG